MALAKYYGRLFEGVDRGIVDQLEALSSLRELAPHSYLFNQYSEARGVFVLEQGVIMIERSSAAGRRQIIAFSYPGDFVGLSHNDYFEYSVESLTHATIREFPRREFLALSDRSPQLKSNMSAIGGSVFSHALDQLFALGQKKAHERVCFLLQEIRDRHVGPSDRTVQLLMTRQDIADYLGLTMETVSRAFMKLKKEGTIAIENNHTIHILNADYVEEMACAK